MNKTTKNKIKALIEAKINNKLKKYERETQYKPFYEAILEKEAILKASLLQSLYTSFGMSIYEQMAVILAQEAGYHVERQYQLLGSIDDQTTLLIEQICKQSIKYSSKETEIANIKDSIQPGDKLEDPDMTVDVFLRKGDEEHYIDITTVKPNKKEVRTLRRKLLRWVALRLSQKHDARISTYIGIPFNPYHPAPYSRSFVVDNIHKSEMLVQNDLWELFAGYDVFNELISVFNEVGEYTKHRIAKFIIEQSN